MKDPHYRFKQGIPGHGSRWRSGQQRHKWRQHSGRLFLRLLLTFGLLAMLVLAGMAAFAVLLNSVVGGNGTTTLLVWILGCGLAVTLPLLALALAVRAFQRFAMPLGNLMEAADAVAGGDLSVRVEEEGPGDFRRLIHSFNHMTGELELADQRRRNLTADVAHELRTPLQIIQGNLEGIQDGVYNADEQIIQTTLEETRSLARLVEDLRILSLAEAGQLPMNLEKVDVLELLQDIHTSFSGQAEIQEISLQISDVGDAEGIFVEGDYGRLNQILTNLVANALVHTAAGGVITLGAESIPEWVVVTIADTGEGISPEELPYIFDRFWRADQSRTRGVGAGSGLGLAIVKQLVEAHHGEIQVRSEPGQGALFVIRLPDTASLR